MPTCLNCSKEFEFKRMTRNKYCGHTCQQDFQMQEKIKSGTAKHKTLKRYLIKVNGNKCGCCGITDWNKKPIVLELEHIDGNSENNNLDNLSIICPNCHSQTATYKGANKGNGRHLRRIRYAEGKSY
jgi:Zn finger protein HypA/HybF involved in hydrogenase expression